MIRVLVADDQQILVEGLSTLLNLEEDICVIGAVKNGEEVLSFLDANPAPDVILMDIRMPKMNGVVCTKEVRSRFPDVRVLVLTTFDDDEFIANALANGACGYLLKDLSSEKLTSAIRNAAAGNTVMDQYVTEKIIRQLKSQPDESEAKRKARITDIHGHLLQEREEQVLLLLAKGYKNAEIAKALFLSEGTVKNYISLLYEKFDIKGRTKLMSHVIALGILEKDGE